MNPTRRAALSSNRTVSIKQSRLDYARASFEKFLSSCGENDNSDFYKIIFCSLVFRLYGEDLGLAELAGRLSKNLSGDDIKTKYLIGEWEYLNRTRSPKNRACVGINAAINAFIEKNLLQKAAKLYSYSRSKGMPSNLYIEKRLGLSR